MEKYIKSISALNTLSLSSKTDEIDRYAESDIFWATNKNKSLPNRKIKKGSVYQCEFGKNFIPEMSYEHRGLVIGSSGKLLYVLPICSYNAKNQDHRNAYHPTDNPKSKSNYYLLKGDEYAFLAHDSVLKLNDIRTISVARIKYKQENGFIDPKSESYQKIVSLVLSKYFFDFSYNFNRISTENKELVEQLNELKSEYELIVAQLELIQDIIEKHGFNDEGQTRLKKVLGI